MDGRQRHSSSNAAGAHELDLDGLGGRPTSKRLTGTIRLSVLRVVAFSRLSEERILP
jgi:hypothetical protein